MALLFAMCDMQYGQVSGGAKCGVRICINKGR